MQRRGDRTGDKVRRRERRKIHETDPQAALVGNLPGDLGGNASLADAAGADDGDEPPRPQPIDD